MLIWWLVRDAPPGARRERTTPERLVDVLRGVVSVWRIQGLGPILAVHTFV